ncbi:protein WVD2-like 6 [Cicer arietinum]|uniref:Protein WVD2-like 5 isoform X1 n=1 Tax=Cicer arietinum TaxID=3827 RepID=A0A1S2Y4M1_CICAR|nr:protein WVD2-like 5 isoform X1 [Cicer arietinum]XP_004498742.1 protein WVD2-like 5 isoform X1 [Cicer arietinum]XP_004498743.1 protein WVD2-like 5 isoform X1 [Cicer arietinum]XP_012570766.1 protein WVD2-like 5 isoform X1 [Cicer arietinum]
MMDLVNPILADGLDEVHQNGVHDEPSNSGEDGGVSNDLDSRVTETIETVAPNGYLENFNQSESTATGDSSIGGIEGSNVNVDGNNTTISKEKEVKKTVQTEQSRAQKGSVKNKNAKVASSSGVHANLVKNSKNAKDKPASSAVSNGTSALESRPKQSIKSRSFNDRQSQASKNPSKSDAASSEVAKEKKKPKSLKPVDKVPDEAESSLTNAEDAKPRRVGTLPNYGFSFKCDERAEKRREFLTKVEEKIQAKEEEKSNLQAKTMESQEKEIKKLRKSLTFKATPMPTFYQEPAPPKVELKKIPTTRAKSPKLGRKKTSTNSESDGNGNSSSQLGRLSLDEKVSHSNSTKGVAPVHQKKPLRKSLPPRLASDRTSSSNSVAGPTSSKAVHDEKTSLSNVTKKYTSLSNATGEEKTEITAADEESSNTLSSETNVALPLNVVPSDKPSEAESHVNGDIVVEENPQLMLSQGPIMTVH